jgi:hypothetical protein
MRYPRPLPTSPKGAKNPPSDKIYIDMGLDDHFSKILVEIVG